MMWPYLIGKELKLPVIWPVIKTLPGNVTLAMDFLKKHYISINLSKQIFDIMQNKFEITQTKSLMDIVCQDF